MRLRRWAGVAARSVPFAGWFVGEMVRANWQVAGDLLTPGLRTTPGVAAVPLRSRSRAEVAVLVDLINLTPGTVAVDVDRGANVLYVLDIYAPDTADGLRAQIHALEARMLRVLRGGEVPAPSVEGPRTTDGRPAG